jgi:hypothetical protein
MIMSDILMTSHLAGSMQAFGKSCGSASRVGAVWLCFAAAPVFAVMALLTAVDGGQQDMLCAAMQPASPFGGMVPMYLLMTAFHSGPWLKLISRGRRIRQQSGLVSARKRAG